MVAEDTDDSEDDILNQSVFSTSSAKKKRKQRESEEISQPSIASLTQESTEKASSNSELERTSEEIEEMGKIVSLLRHVHFLSLNEFFIFFASSIAQEEVQDLAFPLIQETKSMDQLGWHKAKKQKNQKENTWYPCRLCHPDEGKGLFQPHCEDGNRILVRYLGYQSDTAGSYNEIKSSEFFPLTEENRQTAFDTYKRHLARYFKTNLVARRAEELAVISMWDKVQKRANGLSTPDKSCESVDLQSPSLEALSPLKATPTSIMRPNFGSEADDCSSDSDDDNVHATAALKGKREILRDGDVIEYYDPIGVVGNKQWLRRATVLGVDPKNKSTPINLDNGQFLDRNSKIKRIRRRNRGKVEKCDGSFREISEYSLRSCGTMEMVAFQKQVQRVKAIHQEGKEDIEKFWQPEGDENAGRDSATQKPQKVPKEPGDNAPKTSTILSRIPKWELCLEALLERTKEQLAKKRRFVPSMQPGQIETVLKVWEVLQKQFGSSTDRNTKQVVAALSSKLGISTARLNSVMHGDENKTLSIANKNEVITLLEEWLEEPTNLVLDENGDVQRRENKNMTLSRRISSALNGALNKPKKRESESIDFPLSASSASSSTASFDRKEDSKQIIGSSKRRKLSFRYTGSEETKSHPVDEMITFLRAKVDCTKKEMQQTKRFRPHMTIDQLETSMRLWQKAKGQVSEKENIQAFIAGVATQLQLSEHRLESFLRGDENKLVGKLAQEEIMEKLCPWLLTDEGTQ
eukprot:scaffold2816_cov121-Cylindrotheca_fusiformis.AAC.20